jgi:hypothetical protein
MTEKEPTNEHSHHQNDQTILHPSHADTPPNIHHAITDSQKDARACVRSYRDIEALSTRTHNADMSNAAHTHEWQLLEIDVPFGPQTQCGDQCHWHVVGGGRQSRPSGVQGAGEATV